MKTVKITIWPWKSVISHRENHLASKNTNVRRNTFSWSFMVWPRFLGPKGPPGK